MKLKPALVLLMGSILATQPCLALQADTPVETALEPLEQVELTIRGTRLKIVPLTPETLNARRHRYLELLQEDSSDNRILFDPELSFAVLREEDGEPVALSVSLPSNPGVESERRSYPGGEAIYVDRFCVDPSFQRTMVPLWLAHWTLTNAHRQGYQLAHGTVPKESRQTNGYYRRLGARLVEEDGWNNGYELPLSKGVRQIGALAKLLGA